jgi:hypothetical protein
VILAVHTCTGKTMSATYQEIKILANHVRGIDLQRVLQSINARKDTCDKKKWHTERGVLSVSGTKFMNWNTGTGGGGAIDLVIHLKQLDFKTAVRWLAEMFPEHIHKPAKIPVSGPVQPFQVPTRCNPLLLRVHNYLSETRSICTSLIRSLIRSGKLYADTRGNAVFLLLGKQGKAVGAELRGTTHQQWRGMAKGSRKDLGCFYHKNGTTKKMVLCESAIDALSCLILHPDCLAVSTSGVNPNPAWLHLFISHGYEIFCGFDADNTGDHMAHKMMTLYPSVKRLRPAKHDWNQLLKATT